MAAAAPSDPVHPGSTGSIMATDSCNAAVQCVQIGPRCIGPGQRAYVIAEAGVNHNGSIGEALRMVDAARQAGADAVKFQAFKATRLASRLAEQAAYQKDAAGAPSQVEMLERLELKAGEFARLKQHCDGAGIEFLATPFGVEDLRILLDLGVRAVKIASPDIVNRPLLEAAAESRLPMLLSTGASEAWEIDRAHDLLWRQWRVPLVLLHCVSSYPTKLEHANLGRIRALRQRYGCPAGFSDHTTEPSAGALAVAAGASILEKHFTLDRSQPGPDQGFSLLPAELAEYVCQARLAEAAMGDGGLDLGPIEREVRSVSRCSVVTGEDIPAGGVIGRHMLAVKRPGLGISPWQIDEVAGRRAKQHISADTPITWDMLD